MEAQFATAEAEYEKDPSLKRSDVEILQNWLQKQPHLPKLTEFQIITFLHSCYLRTEAAKNAIETYFTIRTHCPEIFSFIEPAAIIKGLDIICVTILPEKTPEGYNIVCVKLLDSDVAKFNFSSLYRLLIMVITIQNVLKGTSNGFVLALDATGYNLAHLMKLNMSLTKKIALYFQDGMPIRLKAIHLINSFSLVDTGINMVKPIIQQDLLSLLLTHTTMETFYKYIPQELMPNDYGGKVGSILELRDKTKAIILEHIDFFKEEASRLVDDSKRMGTSKLLEELFDVGVQGTFRKINID